MRRAALLAALAIIAVPPAVAAAAPISGSRALETVERLSALGPRAAGTAAERRAGDLAAGRLRALGYRVGVQRVPLPGGGASRNVVALSGGPVRVVVAAHVDGVPPGPAANDNASGVAALLEVAGALEGRRGVLIAALGAEERVVTGSGLHLGSARLVRGLRRPPRAAIVLDMVGVGPLTAVRGLEARPAPTARRLLAAARALRLRTTYMADSGLSDHAEMTRAGWPAAWIQRRLDTCWHRPCDTPDRVSARALADSARLAARVAQAALRAPR